MRGVVAAGDRVFFVVGWRQGKAAEIFDMDSGCMLSANDVVRLRAPLHVCCPEARAAFVGGVHEGKSYESLIARIHNVEGRDLWLKVAEEIKAAQTQTEAALAQEPSHFQHPGSRPCIEVDLAQAPTRLEGWVQSNFRRNVYHIFFFRPEGGLVGGRLPRLQSHVEAELPDWGAAHVGVNSNGVVELRSIMSGSTVNTLDRHQHAALSETVDGHRLGQRCAVVKTSSEQLHIVGGEGHVRVFLESAGPVPVLPVDCLESMSNLKEYTNATFPGMVLESRPVCSVWTKSGGRDSPLTMNPPYSTWVLRVACHRVGDLHETFARLGDALAQLSNIGAGGEEAERGTGKRSKNW